MSAGNWAECPRCANRAHIIKDKELADLAKAYGKVDADEYVRRRTEAEKPLTIEQTLREDYGIGIDNDDLEFQIGYKALCTKCGFTFEYSFRQNVTVSEKEKEKKKS